MLNKILTDADRENYLPEVEMMNRACPDMMARKIQNAVVQQAFVLNTVLDYARGYIDFHHEMPVVLDAGSYEDTAGETLKAMGWIVVDVDPVINEDLHTFCTRWKKQVPFVISTSVLEHTRDDEEFIADIAKLLEPGGMAILTCDFLDSWRPGQRVPTTSNRFFTNYDLTNRFPSILNIYGCSVVGKQDYSQKDHFAWEGINYSFATFVFEKKYI